MALAIPLALTHRSAIAVGVVMNMAACIVSGCGSLIEPPPPPQLYVLAPSMGPAAEPGPRVKWQLSVSLPAARANLDTSRIALRKTLTMMDYFADAAWTDRLPLVVHDLLIESFSHTRKIVGVARDTAGIAANYRLDTEMREFEAHYDQADVAPRIVVRLEAKLVALPERNIIYSLAVTQEAPAARNDLDSIVVAFNQAGGSALKQIVDWTFRELPAG